jgi:RNA polymerase sigma-70 factor (ECF subfamily)
MTAATGPHAVDARQWLRVLFEQNADAVYNVAFRITWSAADAEDVVQETFVKAFVKRSELRDQARVRPWLLSIAYRQALAVLRARREAPVDPVGLDGPAADGEGLDPVVLRAERAALVRQAIDRLSDDLRAAVVLRDAEGLPLREVADVLGIGLSAAKMRVARAREQLRADLQGVL